MLSRLHRAYRRHGLAKTCYLVAYNIAYYLRGLRRDRTEDISGSLFDRTYRIETAGIVEAGALDVEAPSAKHAVRYQPSDVDVVRRTLEECQIDYSRYVFLDYGCGKGRVLMLASERPFKEIMGIEFAPELHRIAEANIEQLRRQNRLGLSLRVFLADAMDFEPPEEPLVCYMYNPFGEPVLRAAVGRLERSLEKKPRTIFVIYVDAVHQHAFQSGRWEIFRQESLYVIYRSKAR